MLYPYSSHCDRHDRPGDDIICCSFPRVVVSGEQQSFGPRPHLKTSGVVNHDMSSGFKAAFIISSLVEMLLFAVSMFGCVLPLLYPRCQLESSFIGTIIQNLSFIRVYVNIMYAHFLLQSSPYGFLLSSGRPIGCCDNAEETHSYLGAQFISYWCSWFSMLNH